ncbi:aldehyde dehydrogenase family protein [Glycomyces sp. YM15]|uniref:aldehyde dehydrogenase family protein n=1 Tax=Glycomyces sp. YM15 TaxID=2800446 RepID=UPI001964EA91|nr:aldehyde dehydrogenase family protein [Glycomyces sp. YM15]
MTIASTDPRTGDPVAEAAPTAAEDVRRLAATAAAAAPELERRGRDFRARLLRAVAARLEERRDAIVALGRRETGLPEARLSGELTRTAYQAEFFAAVIEDGGYLEATIDHASDTPMGPGPDLRRLLVPIGPVAVFGASNFPLAFSVPGGDTVSALAAGNPVIVKAHDSHLGLSQLSYEALVQACADVDAPEGTVGIVFGTEAGAALVVDPAVKAVGFTGSLTGGRALLDLINARPEPIPFYGELSSVNPLIVTAAAAAERPEAIANGLVASVTGSGGQLCTKPGVVFVPTGPDGDKLLGAASALIAQTAAPPLLNSRIAASYRDISAAHTAAPGVKELAIGTAAPSEGAFGRPRLLEVDAADFTAAVAEECFGPSAIAVRYADAAELRSAFAALPASLTATLHTAENDPGLEPLVALVRPLAGRLVFDQFPTGVLVSWAQHHGGPWPSTNTLHTSVGATAIRRFLRPMVWQNAPESVLPPELRDDAAVPQRVDGRLRL